MTRRMVTLEAPTPADFARQLAELEHETRAVILATEHGTPWAQVDVSPMTDTCRAVFPLTRDGVRGDTRRRGESGVMVTARDGCAALPVVIERARRMWRAGGVS